MVSRDSIVHIVSVLLAILVFVLFESIAAESNGSETALVVFLLVYGLVFGGAHLYLALQGDDGMVPVGARWRYLAMILVLLGAGAVSLEFGNRTVASVELNTIALLVSILTLIVYFVTENVSAYRESVTD